MYKTTFISIITIALLSPSLSLAGWFTYRDNTMSDANDSVGDALTIISNYQGTSQGIQVCPGVFLTSAHGVLDNPELVRERFGREPRSPLKTGFIANLYPFSPNNNRLMRAKKSVNNYTSPVLRNPKNWNKDAADYLFVKVDNPIESDRFIEPILFSSSEELVKLSNEGFVDVELYRGKPLTKVDYEGYPDFINEKAFKNMKTLTSLLKHPQRVNSPCSLVLPYSKDLIRTDCPAENAVSGSPHIVRVKGKPYLVGLLKNGNSKKFNSPSHLEEGLGNGFVPSKFFCDDYEKVCGKPCVKYEDLLRK